MALNKYLRRLNALIAQYRDIELDQFRTINDEPARIEDLLWFHVDSNSARRTRILTGVHGVRGNRGAGADAKYALPSPYGELIKIFVIETFNKRLSGTEKVGQIGSARKLVSNMKGDLYTQSADSVASCFEDTRLDRVIPFIEFCESHGLMPKVSRRLRSHWRDGRDRTGHSETDKRQHKVADENIIKALGNIFARSVIGDASALNKPEYQLRDAIPAFIGLLCLAAPNRAVAEAPLLTNQKLKSYSEGDKPKVYFLDWSGSKGFRDNRNHVLRSLADKIELGLSFFAHECEPGRILSRYYIKPQQTLRALLGGYPIEAKRKRRLELDRQPHLFTLGYALGFYDVDDEVRVYQKLQSSKSAWYNRQGWTHKRICDLTLDDYISANEAEPARPGIYKLLNFPFKVGSEAKNEGFISIKNLEDAFIELFKKNFPSFPVGYSTGDAGSVHMDSALFCFTGYQHVGRIGHTKSGVPGSGSFYTIVAPTTVGTIAALDLGKNGSLFARYGFPSNYSLLLHQLRHYTNSVADQSGIPIEVITAWSGRKSRDQTTEYIHTSHSDRSERVKSVQTRECDSKKSIRLISKSEISSELNLPASVTSTGVCTQNLITNPCEFLNDFVSSCFLCPSSCYTAGDTNALEILDKDLSFQLQRLSSVEKDARLRVSEVMRKWFVVHTENTSILRQLITILRSQPKGTIISINRQEHQFNIVDVETKSIERVGYALPNAEEALHNILDEMHDGNQPNSNTALQSLLTSFGIEKVD